MKKILKSVMELLTITAFTRTPENVQVLTAEQRQKMVEAFGEKFANDFAASLANDFADESDATTTELHARVDTLQASLDAATADANAVKADKDLLAAQIQQLNAKIDILQNMPEPTPAPAGAGAGDQPSAIMNSKFLFGQNVPFMAIDERHPYNRRAYAMLQRKMGIDMPAPMADSLDYESLKADLGDFYRIRKQDRIQSFLQKLPTLDGTFPLESNYQDRAVLVNVFLTEEFSQANNTNSDFDNMVKGGYKFEPEELRMFDVMFAHKFKDLKQLEKSWLGYLNKEGSDTMKWSFIEFIMVETGTALSNEREMRRINGIRVNPVLNEKGTAIGASDGLREFIRKQISLFKIRPFKLGEWTPTTISDYIRRGTAMVPPVIRDSGRVVLYMSPDAYTDYIKNNESLYGLNQDYKGTSPYVKEYPNVKIVTIPNMAESKLMIWTLQGNIALFEDQPGEMFKFFFEQVDWSLKVWSNWKESIWAYMVGRKWNNAEEIPADYSTQLIFVNDVDFPSTFFAPMAQDDTTPSAARHTSLVSVANTKATVITNIDEAPVGVAITLKCGSNIYPITIAPTGNFSMLSEAFEPVAGESIIVKKRSDGKFVELDRLSLTSTMSAFDPDDATPSVAGHDTFVTDVNTQATAITNLEDAIIERVYTIYGAGTTNASTIANAGNFVLTEAMTLGAGSWIMLQKSNRDGKIYEITRG